MTTPATIGPVETVVKRVMLTGMDRQIPEHPDIVRQIGQVAKALVDNTKWDLKAPGQAFVYTLLKDLYAAARPKAQRIAGLDEDVTREGLPRRPRGRPKAEQPRRPRGRPKGSRNKKPLLGVSAPPAGPAGESTRSAGELGA